MLIRLFKFLVLFILVLPFSKVSGQDPPVPFFEQTQDFFNQYLQNGRVNYRMIKKNPKKLNALIKAIQKSDFNQNTSSDFRKAFWINAYNILVISSVIDNYPLFSIHDVPDFFSQKKFIIHGETLSLNDIETAKLKTVDNDPRINFALCKALAGGPPLNKTAFRPDNMDALLDEQTVALINDTATISLRGENTCLMADFLLENQDDYIFSDGTIINFINRYRKKPVLPEFQINFFETDQRLNDISTGKPGLPVTERVTGMPSEGALPLADTAIRKHALDDFFMQANRFFSIYVNKGYVNYSDIKKHPRRLNKLLELMVSADLNNERNDTKKAYWINTYNLLVIKSVVDRYPVKMADRIPDLFGSRRFLIAGDTLSLDDIEGDKLKSAFKDPRINFSLCKAQIGSPPILAEAYSPELLSTQIITQTVTILNDTNFIKLFPDGSVKLSDFFQENQTDFTFSYGSLSQFINKYRKNSVIKDTLITFFEKNPNLNDEIYQDRIPVNESGHYVFTDAVMQEDFESEADEGQLSGISIVPKRKAEIRINNTLSFFNENYNKRLSRQESGYSYTSNITSVQFFFGAGKKTTIGLTASGRTTRIDKVPSDFSRVYHLKKDTNSTFYLRTLSPVLRFNINEKFVQIRAQTTFNIPITRIRGLKFYGTKYTDSNPYSLRTELFLFKNLSDYVKVGIELEMIFFFNDQFEYFTISPNAYFNTAFSLPLSKKASIYSVMESSPTSGINGLFQVYYFKEGLGFKYRIGKAELTAYYSYIFLGRSVRANNAFVLNLRTTL